MQSYVYVILMFEFKIIIDFLHSFLCHYPYPFMTKIQFDHKINHFFFHIPLATLCKLMVINFKLFQYT